MKKLLYILITGLIAISCKKESYHDSKDFLNQIKSNLKDSMSRNDYSRLDFSKFHFYHIDSIKSQVVQIPFFNSKQDFAIVQIQKNGNIIRGQLIHLEGSDVIQDKQSGRKYFQGKIQISSLNRDHEFSSSIKNGYITAFHQRLSSRLNSILPATVQGDVLPEVVVVAYVSSGGISYSDWMMLQSLFYDSGSLGSGLENYYIPIGGNGSTSTASNGPSASGINPDGSINNGSLGTQGEGIYVDVETYVNHPAIDIAKYLKCFDAIPDNGATCSIEILTDIPVDNRPDLFFNWQNGSPGHTFLKLKKENGGQGFQQVFGWYPVNGWEVIPSPAPVPGKFVDNSNHEFNASYTLNISPDQFRQAINEVLYLSRFIKYDIDEYNCTDFALQVFNSAVLVQDRLEIPKYDIPGGETPFGTNTPNGLYIKLTQLKSSGFVHAENIDIPGYKGWVGPSNGPCN